MTSALRRDWERRVGTSTMQRLSPPADESARVETVERGPEFEARANEEIFAQFPFVCICSFNGARDANGLLQDVLETHPILVSNGIPLANPYGRPWSQISKRNRAVSSERKDTVPPTIDGA